MKKMRILFSAALLSLFSFNSHAQVFVENVDINELDIEYCQILGTIDYPFRRKLNVRINYGQEVRGIRSHCITGSDTEPIEFNSLVEVLNFMSNRGWEIVQFSPLDQPSDCPDQNYLFKKKKGAEEAN